MCGCVYACILVHVCSFGSVYDTSTASIPDSVVPFGSSKTASYGGTTYVRYTWNNAYKRAFVANFFHMLWTLEFLIYFSFMVTAGTLRRL